MKNVPVPGARPGSGVPVPEESWLAGTAVCPRVRIFQYFSRAGGREEGRKGGRGGREGGRDRKEGASEGARERGIGGRGEGRGGEGKERVRELRRELGRKQGSEGGRAYLQCRRGLRGVVG